MGQEMILGLSHDPEIVVVGGCDPRPPLDGAPPGGLPITPALGELLDLTPVDVVVDFTTAEAAAGNAAEALRRSIPIVIGTTGLSEQERDAIDELARAANVAALVAPNFAIGANLLAQFARVASKFFDSAEVIEIHHDGKIDAPSGTALMIAQGMREGRGRPFAGDNVSKHVLANSRGATVEDDLHVHSLRMPGFVATHEVIFGGPGQSLTIRHDSIGRDSFVPGVAFAVKNIRGHAGLIYGLDQLMGLT
jgi:4-hydroxy-tetrahydrodipicolinate reductase